VDGEDVTGDVETGAGVEVAGCRLSSELVDVVLETLDVDSRRTSIAFAKRFVFFDDQG
jgi:hypothetical protein